MCHFSLTCLKTFFFFLIFRNSVMSFLGVDFFRFVLCRFLSTSCGFIHFIKFGKFILWDSDKMNVKSFIIPRILGTLYF